MSRPAPMITRQDIEQTYATIRPYLRLTPILVLPLDAVTGAGGARGSDLVLKLEQLQCAGSFKARGAFANLLLRDIPTAGVVAASGGNHGVAVGYAAHRLGVPAKIFVPAISAPAKIRAIRESGAHLVVGGDRYADALAAAQSWAHSSGSASSSFRSLRSTSATWFSSTTTRFGRRSKHCGVRPG